MRIVALSLVFLAQAVFAQEEAAAPAEDAAAPTCEAPHAKGMFGPRYLPGTRQANISGTASTGPFKKAKPLAERGYSRVGVLVKELPNGLLSKAAVTVFGNRFHDVSNDDLGTTGLLTQLFVARGDGSEGVTVVDLSSHADEIWAHLTWSNWSGEWRFDPKKPDKVAFARSLQERLGIQALLVIQEEAGPDLLHGTTVERGGKGLFERYGAMHAIAAFKTQLVDLQTGLMPKPGYYTQGSGKYLPGLGWRGPWTCYSEAEQATIRTALREVYENNVDRALAIYKIRGQVPREDDWAAAYPPK